MEEHGVYAKMVTLQALSSKVSMLNLGEVRLPPKSFSFVINQDDGLLSSFLFLFSFLFNKLILTLDVDEKTPDTKKTPSYLLRVFKLHWSNDWRRLSLAAICAGVNGGALPVFVYVFTKLVIFLMDPSSETAKSLSGTGA